MDRPVFPQWTILAFVEQLAEGSPLPGGGCAVSVAGALAAALGSLAAQISLKKEMAATPTEPWSELGQQLDQARRTFLDLIDADALAYHEVVRARRLPRNTTAEKTTRQHAIAQAFAQACEPPREMARLGLQVLGWAVGLAREGNPVILADVGVMGFLAAAVVHGGLINIFSNLTMMAEAPAAVGLRSEAAGLREDLKRISREFTTVIYPQVGA